MKNPTMSNRDELDNELYILQSDDDQHESELVKWHKFGKETFCLNKLKKGEAYLMPCHDESGMLSVVISCLSDEHGHIVSEVDWDVLVNAIFESNFTSDKLTEITIRLPRFMREQITVCLDDKKLNSLIQTDQTTEQLIF
jgi:hypothetical protein